MSRGLVRTVIAGGAMVCALAACSGSANGDGTSPSDGSGSPSVATPSTSSTPSQSDGSGSPSVGTTSVSSAPSPSPSSVPTPSGFGAAQPAVDTYLQLVNASNAAFRAPQRVSATQIDKLTAGQAKISFDQSLAAAKKQGIAYRGTPSMPRLTVVSSKLDGTLPSVVLRDCGLESKSDPFVGYYVATGKALPTSTPKVPPPYAKTIKLFQPNKESWVVTSLTTDAAKTCKP